MRAVGKAHWLNVWCVTKVRAGKTMCEIRVSARAA